MNKIIEVVTTPTKVTVGSNFTLRIKAQRYATYGELEEKLTYDDLQNYTYNQIKGE